MGNRAVLSADIAGSTALYDSIGDRRARQLVAACLATVGELCERHGGRVIAEVGDQIVALFEVAADAAAAASEIHAEMHDRTLEDAGLAVRMRIGLHYGPLNGGKDPLAGETAKIASWAGGNAKPEQTLATSDLIEELPGIFRAVSRYVDDETWNFVSLEHVELYEIIWDVESITAFAGEQPERDAQSYDSVTFDFGDDSVTVDAERPVVSIGRNEGNDLVIGNDLVSRQHLSAQFSRGRCTITDNSTNGTVVEMDDGVSYALKRESLRLSGSGRIIPGKPDDKSRAAVTVRYRCD